MPLLDDLALIQGAGTIDQTGTTGRQYWRRLAAIKDRIRGGETTGDLLYDFLILYKNGIEGEAPYRKVMAAVDGKIGQAVLVVREQLSAAWIRGIYPPPNTNPEDIVRMMQAHYGIITGGLEIDQEKGCFFLPSMNHWRCFDNAGWHRLDSPIFIDPFDIPYLDHDLSERRDGIEPRSITIKVGEEVLHYFCATGRCREYRELQELLRDGCS